MVYRHTLGKPRIILASDNWRVNHVFPNKIDCGITDSGGMVE